MTQDTHNEISKAERAVMKQRLLRISQILQELDDAEREIGGRRSKLIEEQAKLNAKVHRA
jgi:hypothetical protein